MNDGFESKVRGAAVAGWWTVLAGFAVLVLQWLVYLAMMRWRPAWASFVLAPGMTWDFLGNTWWYFTAFLKVFLGGVALLCLWLTLWARQLRTTSGGRTSRPA